MMQIPPSKFPPSSSTSGKESGPGRVSSDKGKTGKDFKLPSTQEKGTDQGTDEKEIAKKGKGKTLFDVSAAKTSDQTADELAQIAAAGETGTTSAQQMASIDSQASVAKIADLITTMVDRVGIGTIGGKSYASLDLKASPEVPDFFAGATLTLTQTDRGLNIQFTNMTTQQQQAAVTAIEQNKQQLAQLQLNLQARNITLANLQIGDRIITLPQVQPTKPIEPPAKTVETEPHKGKGREDQGAGPQGGPE